MTMLNSPELVFAARVHDMVAKAEKLIEIYIPTLETFESLPEDFDFPNKEESIALVELTLETLMELKVAVTAMYEHTSDIHDKIDSALVKLENLKKD